MVGTGNVITAPHDRDRVIQKRAGFTDLGKTADGIGQAYLTFKLSNTCATDLSMLSKGKHLQKLELGRNELSDLKHLRGKESLVYLNVSGEAPTAFDHCQCAGIAAAAMSLGA
jgi:hypothetical protein